MEKPVSDVTPNDVIDLEGDKYADPDGADPIFRFVYAVVGEVEQESPGVLLLHTNHGTFAFPPNHEVTVVGDVLSVSE
jgi:hypothetical protein